MAGILPASLPIPGTLAPGGATWTMWGPKPAANASEATPLDIIFPRDNSVNALLSSSACRGRRALFFLAVTQADIPVTSDGKTSGPCGRTVANNAYHAIEDCPCCRERHLHHRFIVDRHDERKTLRVHLDHDRRHQVAGNRLNSVLHKLPAIGPNVSPLAGVLRQ